MQDVENIKRLLKSLTRLENRFALHKRILGRDLSVTDRFNLFAGITPAIEEQFQFLNPHQKVNFFFYPPLVKRALTRCSEPSDIS